MTDCLFGLTPIRKGRRRKNNETDTLKDMWKDRQRNSRTYTNMHLSKDGQTLERDRDTCEIMQQK